MTLNQGSHNMPEFFSQVIDGANPKALAKTVLTFIENNKHLDPLPYVLIPLGIIVLIVIWLMVGFKWITWPVGSYLSILFLLILYGSYMAYRNNLRELEKKIKEFMDSL